MTTHTTNRRVQGAQDTTYSLHPGDVLDVLRQFPNNCFDGCFGDPPYELGFMNKAWDSSRIAFSPEVWGEVYRVLIPGAHLLAFGGSRTFHRLTCAIEDAGFEIRDHLMWVHGQGFPKSKSLLKPAYEPIVLARKQGPLLPLNIDRSRIGSDAIESGRIGRKGAVASRVGNWGFKSQSAGEPGRSNDGREICAGEKQGFVVKGRWPANLALDTIAAALLDAQSGNRRAGREVRAKAGKKSNSVFGTFNNRTEFPGYHDEGGASRFFYVAKASARERDSGMCPQAQPSHMVENDSQRSADTRNNHPCVKPIDLTRWLAGMILPPRNGRLLVPFAGTGSEMIGAILAGWNEVTGIELEQQWVNIAADRLRYFGNEGQESEILPAP